MFVSAVLVPVVPVEPCRTGKVEKSCDVILGLQEKWPSNVCPWSKGEHSLGAWVPPSATLPASPVPPTQAVVAGSTGNLQASEDEFLDQPQVASWDEVERQITEGISKVACLG